MNKIFIEAIRERDWVETPFLVRDKITAMAKNGKPYMTVKLVDRSGEIEGRIWERVDEFDVLFQRDDFVVAGGKASVYLGKMQLIIQDLRRIDESEVDLADFLPVSRRPAAMMEAELDAVIASLADADLSRLLTALFADADRRGLFCRAPAAKSMHHVYIGGLLEHSLAVCALVDDVCRRYPQLDRDLLICGALLHDLGKIGELSYSRTFDYTDEGRLIGHLVLGVEMIDDVARSLGNISRERLLLLKHLILSHHGQYEYGSPKRPKTLEALVLNFLDDLDAKINGVSSHLEREAETAGSWTSFHRLYDRAFYRGEHGPAAVPAPAALPPSPPAVKSPNRPAEKKPFGTSLGEQLQHLNLDLFAEQKGEEK